MRFILMLTALIVFSASASIAADGCPRAPEVKDSTVVIKMAGGDVTLKDVDASIATELCAARMAYDMKLNELRQGAAEELLMTRLIAAEVKKKGLKNEQELIKSEVMTHVKPPSEEEIKALYEEVKERLGGQPYEAAKGKILAYLKEQAVRTVYQNFIERLKSESKAKVELPVYRLPVPVTGPSKGPADAKVVIVEYADYECPYCVQAGETLNAVMKKYPKDVRVVFKDFPLGFHANAVPAAVGARCAGKQGKFWEMHEALFAHHDSLSAEKISELAKGLSLDMKAFAACTSDPAHAKAIEAEQAEGGRYGVEGTPAFFVNGIPLSGAQPLEAFVPIIERELGR